MQRTSLLDDVRTVLCAIWQNELFRRRRCRTSNPCFWPVRCCGSGSSIFFKIVGPGSLNYHHDFTFCLDSFLLIGRIHIFFRYVYCLIGRHRIRICFRSGSLFYHHDFTFCLGFFFT